VLKDKLELSKIIDLISTNPRKIIGTKIPKIKEKEPADITLFDPTQKWIYTKNEICSISKNTPFINYEFFGKSLGIINNGKILITN